MEAPPPKTFNSLCRTPTNEAKLRVDGFKSKRNWSNSSPIIFISPHKSDRCKHQLFRHLFFLVNVLVGF